MKYILPIFFLLIISTPLLAEQYSVIVNSSNNANLDIKNYYLLQYQRWPNKSIVEPYDVSINEDLVVAVARNVFIKKFLKFPNASSYLEYWLQQKSKGKTKKPQVLDSYSDVLRFVRNEQGGVGFVPSRMAKGVRVIETFELENQP